MSLVDRRTTSQATTIAIVAMALRSGAIIE
jgi:hypothetical protein